MMFALSMVFTLILLTVCPPVIAIALKAKARRK
jgi:hypothetical protein